MKVVNSGKSHILEKQYGKVKRTNSSKSSKNKKKEATMKTKEKERTKTKKNMKTYCVLNADPTFTSDSICCCFGIQSPTETVGGEGSQYRVETGLMQILSISVESRTKTQ